MATKPPNTKRKMGVPRRWGIAPSGRERFVTMLKPDTVKALREVGNGWANRGIENLVERYHNEHAAMATRND